MLAVTFVSLCTPKGGKMSIEYIPATGVGRFNAKLNGNSLQIKHRLSLVSNAQKKAAVSGSLS
jgi:hypothetical protein